MEASFVARAATITRARSPWDTPFAASAHRPCGPARGCSAPSFRAVLRHLGTRRFGVPPSVSSSADDSAGIPPGRTALYALAAANPAFPNLAGIADVSEPAPALRILFAAGGTGGHVFPAIAIADSLRRMSDEGSLPNDATASIDFAGTDHHQEATHVPAAGYNLHRIPAIALTRPVLSWSNVLVPAKLTYAVLHCIALITRLKPDVVVGTGGYVSLPVCLASVACRVPLVIQEQNAYPGIANRILASFATLVCVAFARAADAFRIPLKGSNGAGDRTSERRGCVVRGNPVRSTLRWRKREDARRTASWMFYRKGCDQTPRIGTEDRVLAVFGGSMGCETLNDAMAHAVTDMLNKDEHLWVVWQTGRGGYEGVKSKVPSHPRLAVRSFIDDVENVYNAADLCVARAGAVTCSELLACGLPSILIPSPVVAEDHQTYNAKEMADLGAAVEIRDVDLAPKESSPNTAGGLDNGEPAPRRHVRLEYVIGELLYDTEVLAGMRESCLDAAHPEAADAIANDVVSIALAARRKRRGSKAAA